MHLYRTVLSWSGTQVKGNAVTVLHWDGSNQSAPPVAAIKGAFDSVASMLPSGVTVTTPNSGDTIEDTTGHLAGAWTGTGGGITAGTGNANCPAGVGACITWATGGIVPGKKGPRRLRGRTFLVPLMGGSYDQNGTLYDTALPIIQTFAANLQAAGPLAIWHRPLLPGGSDGTSYGVVSNKVNDKTAWLSSRRD